MMRAMSASGYYQGAVMSAISGIEMALWDITGQAIGVPIWQLIGTSDQLPPTDYSLGIDDPATVAERARRVARRMQSGMVHINYANLDPMAPFGGYKQSGNGREWGPLGIEEFLQTKSIYGYADQER